MSNGNKIDQSMLRPERTLTARVDALERENIERKREIDATRKRLDKAGIPSETKKEKK